MTQSTVRRRSRVARTTGVLSAMALAGTGVVATSTTAVAEETPAADLPSLQTFDAEAFAEEAANLPAGLVTAIERDLGYDSAAEYLANAEASKTASHVLNALGEAGVSINGSVYDADSQGLTIYVEAEADVPLVEGVGAKVEVGDAPSHDYPTDGFEAQADWKGGYGYASEPDESGSFGRCSTGFNGYAADASPVILTAGHCNEDNEDHTWVHFDVDAPVSPVNPDPQFELGTAVGQGGDFQFGDEHDAGLFPVTNTDDWEFPARVSQWGGEAAGGAPEEGEMAVRDHVDPVVGQEICRSGASSGFQCGEVLSIDESVNVEGSQVTGFFTNACSTQGDSGGSYISGNAAVGVLSAGNYQNPGEQDACENWEGATPDNPSGHISIPYAVSGSEYSALEYYGDDFELNVDIATPELEYPVSGSETVPAPTFVGTVNHGSPNYTANLTIDGETEYTSSVGSDGEFRVEVEDALEPGGHTYELAITYGNHSSSEVVEGSFNVAEEEPVEELTVSAPGDDQTTTSTRPSFTGEGHPGAEVALTAGGETYGTATVGDDGSWTIEPESDLPVGERFDAVITQTFEGDEQEVTVSNLGIKAAEATITVPEDSSEVGPDVVFEGTAHPGSDLAIMLESGSGDADDQSLTAQSGDVEAQDEGDEPTDTWPGEWTFEGNAWTFTPEEPLDEGEYTVTVNTAIGSDADLGESSAAATFTVAGGGGDAGGGDDGLPDTGSSTTPLIIGAIVLLLGGGAALVTVRARRNGSVA